MYQLSPMDERFRWPRAQGQPGANDAAARGRMEEFVRRFVRYEQDVQAYILSLVPSLADAEEIFQETSARLFQQVDQWDPERDFRAWACTVAYYQVLTYRKRTVRERSRFSQAVIDAIAEQQTVESEWAEARREALAECVKKLDARSRKLLELAYVNELQIDEIAAQLARSAGGINTALSRVRRTLRECILRALRVLEQ